MQISTAAATTITTTSAKPSTFASLGQVIGHRLSVDEVGNASGLEGVEECSAALCKIKCIELCRCAACLQGLSKMQELKLRKEVGNCDER